jgi:hypothetical protein
VIGHTHEVHRRVNVDVVAKRMLDGLSLSILEGIVWSRDAFATGITTIVFNEIFNVYDKTGLAYSSYKP